MVVGTVSFRCKENIQNLHCMTDYLSKPILNKPFNYTIKWVNGIVIKLYFKNY